MKREVSADAQFSELSTQQVAESVAQSESEEVDLDSGKPHAIPKEVNELVVKWINYFTGKGRKHMVKYLERSTRYAPLMKELLKKEGLPEDLIYLALIESGFSSGAKSHASAVGYWQFIRGTARLYGLQVAPLIDERRDFVLSTQAAAKYLKSLYNLFGSWYLAIASYNVGENRVKRVVMQRRTRDFWELIRHRGLPRETIDYVPKYLAARMIALHPDRFGFSDVEYQAPLQYEEIEVPHAVSMEKLASTSNIDVSELRDLNPMYRTDFIPEARVGRRTFLRVPVGKSQLVAGAFEEAKTQSTVAKRYLAEVEQQDGVRHHRVRAGETLGVIARKYGVRISALKDFNEINRRSRLRIGQTLKIPLKKARRYSSHSSRYFNSRFSKVAVR